MAMENITTRTVASNEKAADANKVIIFFLILALIAALAYGFSEHMAYKRLQAQEDTSSPSAADDVNGQTPANTLPKNPATTGSSSNNVTPATPGAATAPTGGSTSSGNTGSAATAPDNNATSGASGNSMSNGTAPTNNATSTGTMQNNPAGAAPSATTNPANNGGNTGTNAPAQ